MSVQHGNSDVNEKIYHMGRFSERNLSTISRALSKRETERACAVLNCCVTLYAPMRSIVNVATYSKFYDMYPNLYIKKVSTECEITSFPIRKLTSF